MQENVRRVLLAVTVLAIVGAIVAIERPWSDDGCSTVAVDSAEPGRAAPDFCQATAWIGEPALLQDLQGKVVLVDFWTYSCINCIRTLPHLTAWYDTYRAHGFVIVGVHSPEFAFEKDPDNVRAAMQQYGIDYPVVQDNDHRIWDNYHNRYWPAKYLVDAHGIIRYTHFGEGDYEHTEQVIRQLLTEAGQQDLPLPVEGTPAPGGSTGHQTPEIYAGYGRGARSLGNSEGYHPGEDVTYQLPAERAADLLYLDGTWHNGEEAVTALGAQSVTLRFSAGAANLVADGHGCAQVTLDGAVPSEQAGRDLHDGCLELDGARSYDFYAGPFSSHEVHIRFPDGTRLYTFAFSGEPVP